MQHGKKNVLSLGVFFRACIVWVLTGLHNECVLSGLASWSHTIPAEEAGLRMQHGKKNVLSLGAFFSACIVWVLTGLHNECVLSGLASWDHTKTAEEAGLNVTVSVDNFPFKNVSSIDIGQLVIVGQYWIR